MDTTLPGTSPAASGRRLTSSRGRRLSLPSRSPTRASRSNSSGARSTPGRSLTRVSRRATLSSTRASSTPPPQAGQQYGGAQYAQPQQYAGAQSASASGQGAGGYAQGGQQYAQSGQGGAPQVASQQYAGAQYAQPQQYAAPQSASASGQGAGGYVQGGQQYAQPQQFAGQVQGGGQQYAAPQSAPSQQVQASAQLAKDPRADDWIRLKGRANVAILNSALRFFGLPFLSLLIGIAKAHDVYDAAKQLGAPSDVLLRARIAMGTAALLIFVQLAILVVVVIGANM